MKELDLRCGKPLYKGKEKCKVPQSMLEETWEGFGKCIIREAARRRRKPRRGRAGHLLQHARRRRRRVSRRRRRIDGVGGATGASRRLPRGILPGARRGVGPERRGADRAIARLRRHGTAASRVAAALARDEAAAAFQSVLAMEQVQRVIGY